MGRITTPSLPPSIQELSSFMNRTRKWAMTPSLDWLAAAAQGTEWPAVGDYDYLVHLLASNDKARSLLVGSANYSTILMNPTTTRNERNETPQHQETFLSFDFDHARIQPQGVHVVDRVQLSSWLPPARRVRYRNERNDFDPIPILQPPQEGGVHVVDRVQLSPWLPPDGSTRNERNETCSTCTSCVLTSTPHPNTATRSPCRR
jgi:hypothetical protein